MANPRKRFVIHCALGLGARLKISKSSLIISQNRRVWHQSSMQDVKGWSDPGDWRKEGLRLRRSSQETQSTIKVVDELWAEN